MPTFATPEPITVSIELTTPASWTFATPSRPASSRLPTAS
jgi:hypothetical protein